MVNVVRPQSRQVLSLVMTETVSLEAEIPALRYLSASLIGQVVPRPDTQTKENITKPKTCGL